VWGGVCDACVCVCVSVNVCVCAGVCLVYDGQTQKLITTTLRPKNKHRTLVAQTSLQRNNDAAHTHGPSPKTHTHIVCVCLPA